MEYRLTCTKCHNLKGQLLAEVQAKEPGAALLVTSSPQALSQRRVICPRCHGQHFFVEILPTSLAEAHELQPNTTTHADLASYRTSLHKKATAS